MNLKNCLCWALPVFAASVLLKAEVSAPHIGFVRYTDGSVCVLNGLRSNFVIGTRLFSGAAAASFGNEGGLVALAGEIDVVDRSGHVIGRYNTDETQPQLDVKDELTSATAWLPSKATLLRWDGETFVASVGEAPEPLFHHKSFTLFSQADSVVVQAADGTVRTLPVSGKDVQIERMASDWLHLSSASAHRDWALFLTENEMHLSELPAPPKANQ